jgi:Protein of unknown function (DUF433)
MGQIPHKRIVSDPEIMMGKPTIKGTRITVELVLEKLGDGRARSRRSVFCRRRSAQREHRVRQS